MSVRCPKKKCQTPREYLHHKFCPWCGTPYEDTFLKHGGFHWLRRRLSWRRRALGLHARLEQYEIEIRRLKKG